MNEMEDPRRSEAERVAARAAAEEAGKRIAREFADLSRSERSRLVTIFRVCLIPRRPAGRKPKKEITAAYHDYLTGMRGVALYRKHITGFDRMSRWRRQYAVRTLMEAIWARERRAKKGPRQSTQPDTPPST